MRTSSQETRPSSSTCLACRRQTGFSVRSILLPAAALVSLQLIAMVLVAAERPAVFNTQPESIPRMSAADAVKGFSLPPGFNATVFAQEPDVQQPIAIATDSRGRLWVAENYTYSESGVNFHPSLLDQIVILEDADHDGRAEKRTVFWDQARKLTGLVPGLGGVYALCPPQLLFLADRDGDDRPDGPPEVLLDGWNDNVTRHTIVNGLKWGPDGWLYGRQGIQATSQVGRPGAAEHERIPINVGLWRFHPRTHRFEALCHGTTNPWGHDWDEHGQLFFINTVIGHLWHVVPGAYYRRMYGEHFNPHIYEVIEQTADHFHWDTREIWHEIRKLGVSDGTSKAGGGHAHSGLMIYLGDNWPSDYRNRVFAMNYHGRRINQDILERKGAGYVGKHAPDFMHVTDPWFRGIDLLTGPDGGVFVADWSDIGECHDHDGIHRTSGRIYKITHGTVRRPDGRDIRSLNENDLADLHRHPNEWQARQARLALQERFYNGRPMGEPRTKLIRWVQDKDPASLRLRALWGLHVTGGVPPELLLQLLDDESEALRVGSIQLLTDQTTPTVDVLERFTRMAQNDTSGLVLTFLASAMGKAPIADRWPLAAALSTRSTFAADPTLPLLTWYGIQPAILADPQKAMELAKGAGIPKIQQFTTRHLCEDWDSGRAHAANLLSWASNPSNGDVALSSIVLGISEALEGRRKAEAPPGWSELGRRLRDRASAGTQTRLRELDLLFGEGRAAEPLRKLALDPNQGAVERRHALRSLVQSRAEGTV
ncbi:MAG: dehydrogenase, partial [Verrucomicrobia bacterium]|nr:dehydrogenase [Verrucomicrobiota bacterium]